MIEWVAFAALIRLQMNEVSAFIHGVADGPGAKGYHRASVTGSNDW